MEIQKIWFLLKSIFYKDNKYNNRKVKQIFIENEHDLYLFY